MSDYDLTSVAVVIPVLNPDPDLKDTVLELQKAGFTRFIVVNDGSDEQHLQPFEDVKRIEGVRVLTHEVNKGKGRAMKTAFEDIQEQGGFAGVVTVDADGQHLPKDVASCSRAMLAEAEAGRKSLILGTRDFTSRNKNIPWKSRMGNRITSLVFLLTCQTRIPDTQTGLRAFSSDLIPDMLEIEGERYEYETQQLLELKRRHIGKVIVPIETVYEGNNEGSHFHPVRDSIRIYRLILKFLASSILAFLIDLGIFTLIIYLVGDSMPDKERIFLATVVSRCISSLVNFFVNHKFVFRSQENLGRTMIRYYILCAIQMLCSYLLVTGLTLLCGANGLLITVLKVIVDFVLFIISYQIQQRIVFKSGK